MSETVTTNFMSLAQQALDYIAVYVRRFGGEEKGRANIPVIT
jgi:hypothetical protein